jgi:tetratricopeptide (TPR) repeat protein
VALNPYDADNLGILGDYLAFSGLWDERTALAEKAIRLTGAEAYRVWRLALAKRHWFRGEDQEAYDAFQRSYQEGIWLSRLDLAYTLPFLGRIDEAKAHVAPLLKMVPSMSIREADALYKLTCFDAAYREKMVAPCARRACPSRRFVRQNKALMAIVVGMAHSRPFGRHGRACRGHPRVAAAKGETVDNGERNSLIAFAFLRSRPALCGSAWMAATSAAMTLERLWTRAEDACRLDQQLSL